MEKNKRNFIYEVLVAMLKTHICIHAFLHEFAHLVYAMVFYFYLGKDVPLPTMRINIYEANGSIQLAGAVRIYYEFDTKFTQFLLLLTATAPLHLYSIFFVILYTHGCYWSIFYVICSFPYWGLSNSDIRTAKDCISMLIDKTYRKEYI